jgi:hypothetical protein
MSKKPPGDADVKIVLGMATASLIILYLLTRKG